ncbi:MAG TPA: serine protease [Candidatus Acidoferrum sp.]|nr:serine protease [Candidatus Acidoferrum sp.]
MSLQRALSLFIVCSPLFLTETASLNSVVFAQDLSNTVLPITEFKLKLKKESLPSSIGLTALVPKIAPAIEEDFGTGFCVDTECRLIGTNYHVAAFARPHKIKGQRVIQRYLATGPDDEGATLNDYLSDRPLKYTLNRDLAIFELRNPLPHFHGIAFSLDDLELDEQVDIYAYPGNFLKPIRKLVQFHGAYQGKTTAGFLAFEYEGKPIHGGSSGGLVVDSKTHQIVGILCRAGLGTNAKAVALAVPVESLADFVSRVQPWLANKIFPTAKGQVISPNFADFYPKFVPPPPSRVLQNRPDEPPEVKTLRKKAQQQADSMRNLVAVQSLAWGSGNKAPAAFAEYEVKILEGFQRFREYPDGKKELQNVPFPPLNDAVVPGGEWSELPQMVGTALRLKIRQASGTFLNGHPIKVFQYQADSEDGVCIFKSVTDLVFGSHSRIVSASCYGEVWTDANLNILRASLHLELPSRWKDYQSVVTYGWLKLQEEEPRLIPLTISTQVEFKKKVYWCRGLFTNYRMFTSRSRIVAGDYVQSLPH